jgi:hypothetical protein
LQFAKSKNNKTQQTGAQLRWSQNQDKMKKYSYINTNNFSETLHITFDSAKSKFKDWLKSQDADFIGDDGQVMTVK